LRRALRSNRDEARPYSRSKAIFVTMAGNPSYGVGK
jgi:hypothetical protein